MLRYPLILRSQAGPILLLDGFKGVDATLKTRRVDVLKINSDELVALAKLSDDLDQAAAFVFSNYLHPSSCLAVTRGGSPALLYEGTGTEGAPPKKWQFQVWPRGVLSLAACYERRSSLLCTCQATGLQTERKRCCHCRFPK